jgi:transcriptional regulator
VTVAPKKKADLLQGTLDLLILRVLGREPLHGWAVSRRIRHISEGVLEVNQGSLYPALHRLRDRGLVRSAWEISEDERNVKVYELTQAGRKVLEEEEAGWRRFSAAVEQILDNA